MNRPRSYFRGVAATLLLVGSVSTSQAQEPEAAAEQTFQDMLRKQAAVARAHAEDLRKRLPAGKTELDPQAKVILVAYHYKLEIEHFFLLWSERADGTRPPEKTCIAGDIAEPEPALVARIAARQPQVGSEEEALRVAAVLCQRGPELQVIIEKITQVVEEERNRAAAAP